MDDDDVEVESYAPIRPYSAECDAAGDRKMRESRRFRPTLPTERRDVEQSDLSSAPAEMTVESLLWEASRRQDADAFGRRDTAAPERFRGMELRKFGLGAAGAMAKEAASLASQLGGKSAAPRKFKEIKAGRSMDLMDLAFMNMRRTADNQFKQTYAPISLPYFDDAENQGGQSSTGKRPAMTHVDEANANAAKELFLTPEGDLQEERYILMQLPSVLPELLDPLDEVQREEEDAASAGAGATITRLPDGLVGKMRIHKSGKVRMEIGGLPFCVDQGCDTFFQQDLACVCPLANEIIDLGHIQKRMVLTPDVDAMLAELETAVAAAT